MGADLLREAASLMRERAEAATPGPWIAEYSKSSGNCVIDAESQNCLDSVARTMHYRATYDANHIASWHPAVALAVADWLARESMVPIHYGHPMSDGTPVVISGPSRDAVTVARAYLGRDS